MFGNPRMLCSTSKTVWRKSDGVFQTLRLPQHLRLLLLRSSLSQIFPIAAISPTVNCYSSSSVTSSKPEESHPRHVTPFVVFDTAKNCKCRLTTRRPNILTWYSCGPTVYDSAHIGHASSFIRQDVIRRILEGMNKEVTVIQIMGITDVDDKIIKKANDTGVEWSSVSRNFEQEFVEDLASLNITSPHVLMRVSDYISQILRFVERLVEMGVAYEVPDGSVYFDTTKYGDKYGVFRQAALPDEAEDGVSTSSSDGKRNPKDFALWKGAKPGEPFWTSPWGTSKKGRPGWHIECSVMASQYFGPSLDLHTGGRDLIFPHHENEEAQCCAHFQSSQWTSHWLHMGHLHFQGDVKMSKSLGNTVSIRNFLDEFSPDVLRVMCIMSKYRKNIEYSKDTLDISKKLLGKLQAFLTDTGAILNGTKQVTLSNDHDENSLWSKLEKARTQLNTALLDDFDTPEALKIVTEMISDFNRHYYVPAAQDTFSPVDFQLVLAIQIFVQNFVKIVGLSSQSSSSKVIKSHNDSHQQDPRLENVLSQFIQFRNQVRSYALAMEETNKELRRDKKNQRKELLHACDKVRDEMLRDNQVELKDYGNKSSWAFKN